ncbi:hypothetical protein DES40_1394 [Litorimonas taeanensis]|uniref:DUF1272 domain-containing protein n=1 Tax=Litorimonas taeanensis TaxID=568099 RepID=A0A420WM19_9PROT|nr:hypothetical protein DES40_1394 [Litorimonas taeanensis]
MLEMRPNCEICDCDLPATSPIAKICSFECTFCQSCVSDNCPNCGGDLQFRPTRTGKSLERHPASTKRVLKPR